MGNKVALALLALAASIVVAACGGTQEAADLAGTSTPTSPLKPPRRGRTDPHKSCDAQGINSTQLGTGACTEEGVQYVVANYGGVVRLRTIAVTIVGVGVAPADENGRRTVPPQRDAFLRFKLQVQNRDRVPHRFDFNQTMLGIGASNYLERIDVERRVHPESLAHAGTMQPGETLTGDVLFDITEPDYRELQRRGRFFVWNFGDHASAQLSRRAGQLGQIRLYAGEVSPEDLRRQQRSQR